jgi:GT2 family glycosyltransferase
MRILLVCPNNITGVEYHRLITPHTHMEDVTSIPSIDHQPDSFFYDFDIIVTSSVISKIGNQELLWKQLKRIGIPVVIDRDDTWVLPQAHPMYKEWQKKQRAKDIIYNLRQVNWVDMAAPLINVKKYKQIGGFDLAFKGYFADIDLCHRANAEGFKMYVDDTLKVEHLGGYTVQKEAKHEQASMSDNDILIKKYGKSWNELCQ